MAIDIQLSEILKAVKQIVPILKRWPVSVYRLNFSQSFTFRDAAKLLPYLHDLGITDIYASPYLKSRSDSTHGYDVTDHSLLNPEIGTRSEYDYFVRRLREYDMGQIMDFIPNHMCIFENSRWQDVLENGPSSSSARFFDIDWEPVKTELHNKVLLPILEDLYGNVLQSGYLTLGFDNGAFYIAYRNHRLPIGPKTAVVILEDCLDPLKNILSMEHPDYLELESIITACGNLPERSEIKPEKVGERQREKEIIKKRLRELCSKNREFKKALQEEIKSVNGEVGDNSSFSKLHDLLEKQVYRLSCWRVAADEINYRRFFDINEFVAIKMEDPVVFKESHRLVRELLIKGAVTGIRIDHVDGLFDPSRYLWRLQKAYWLDSSINQLVHNIQLNQLPRNVLEDELSHLYEAKIKRNPMSSLVKPLYIVVEKILSENEKLRESWPVDGTTGYDFMTALNRLFVYVKHKRNILYTYRQFTGNLLTFEEIVYRSKSLVMTTSMSAEVNLLAHQLDKVSEKSWQYRDFTLNSLKDAIREVIAAFPVYRTYINAYSDVVEERDKYVVNTAINRAKRRNPAVSSAIFDFIKDTLLLQYPTGMSEEGREQQRLFIMRFQQFTGPVMAKGVEDTAFYIYNPLISLNEVGGYPGKFGSSVKEFHDQNLWCRKNMPYSLISTSTHDSKRSEDVRARLNVISEIPKEWSATLKRWRRLNEKKKVILNGEYVPDGNEEYLIYQTLLGTYPQHTTISKEYQVYLGRIQQYLLKAMREAKIHTSWINPDNYYEESVINFISNILEPSISNQFLTDFKTFLVPVATCGIYNSLSQVVLKILSPGVPDIYQGNELWDFSLADPDNRRPVDFGRCIQLLAKIRKQGTSLKSLSGLIRKLMETKQEGLIKLYITWILLNYKRKNTILFEKGNYIPLKAVGARRDNVCSFSWENGGYTLVVTVPRFLVGLTNFATIEPLGVEVWNDTHILLPGKIKLSDFRNVFTGEDIKTIIRTGESELSLAEVFATFPVAVLESKTV